MKPIRMGLTSSQPLLWAAPTLLIEQKGAGSGNPEPAPCALDIAGVVELCLELGTAFFRFTITFILISLSHYHIYLVICSLVSPLSLRY